MPSSSPACSTVQQSYPATACICGSSACIPTLLSLLSSCCVYNGTSSTVPSDSLALVPAHWAIESQASTSAPCRSRYPFCTSLLVFSLAQDTRTWRLSQVTFDAQRPAVRADLTASDRRLMHGQRTTLSHESHHLQSALRLLPRRTLFLVLHNLIPTSAAASEPPRLHQDRGAFQREKVTALLPASAKACSLSLAPSAAVFLRYLLRPQAFS